MAGTYESCRKDQCSTQGKPRADGDGMVTAACPHAGRKDKEVFSHKPLYSHSAMMPKYTMSFGEDWQCMKQGCQLRSLDQTWAHSIYIPNSQDTALYTLCSQNAQAGCVCQEKVLQTAPYPSFPLLFQSPGASLWAPGLENVVNSHKDKLTQDLRIGYSEGIYRLSAVLPCQFLIWMSTANDICSF